MADRLHFLPVNNISIGNDILFRFDILGLAELWSFSQQRLVFLLDVDASTIFIVVSRIVSLLGGTANGLVQSVLVDSLGCLLHLFGEFLSLCFGHNGTNRGLSARLELLFLFYLLVK